MKKLFTFLLISVLILCGCNEKSSLPVISEADISSVSNAKLAWGLKKNKGAKPDANPGADKMLKEYGAYYVGDTSQKNIYLTFDEGYENGYTDDILDILKKHSVPACFFITGPYLEKESDLVMRMVNEGHEVGNHTVNHPSLPTLQTVLEVEEELRSLDLSFYSLCQKNMKFMRPPMGEYSERTLAIAQNMGYTTVFWSIAYVDWDTSKSQGIDFVYRSVMDYLHDGAVILMHAVSKDNAAALEKIIIDAKSAGYTFKPITELSQPM